MLYKMPLSKPIAIVGAVCRFEGGTTAPSHLWRLLEKQTDLRQEIPASRVNIKESEKQCHPLQSHDLLY